MPQIRQRQTHNQRKFFHCVLDREAAHGIPIQEQRTNINIERIVGTEKAVKLDKLFRSFQAAKKAYEDYSLLLETELK